MVASFFTSAMTAAFGIGGGLAMLALMGVFLPVAVLIPVHGLVQLGSNAGRAWRLRTRIPWRALAPFMAAGVIGAALAGAMAVQVPDAALKITLGVFVLVLVWGRLPKLAAGAPWVMALGGFVTTGLTMVLGATGPLVNALFAHRFDRKELLVAASATAMSFQHGVKIAAFGLLGFTFSEWIGLVVAMVLSGYLGTIIGIRLLTGLAEDRFRHGFRIILTVLAADLIRRGVTGL